jgi:hypothetical protein
MNVAAGRRLKAKRTSGHSGGGRYLLGRRVLEQDGGGTTIGRPATPAPCCLPPWPCNAEAGVRPRKC